VPVTFTARDSLIIRLDSLQGDRGVLYGTANVTYQDFTLDANEIRLLLDRDELEAAGTPSDTGLVGRPQVKQGEETFTVDQLAFNLQTERGRMIAARTQMPEGFIRAGIAKIREDSTLFIKDGVYTTCECVDDPSYSLRAERMKVVNRKWIYTGPLRLYLFNIPTPLWLPFGLLPALEGRRSGPLPPSYGEDQFGFYLRDWGWYFPLSDYTDVQVQAGLWSKGSFEAGTLFRYNRRYAYSGNLQVRYGRFKSGLKRDPDFSINRTGSLRWTHNQELSPSTDLNANVDLSSSGYLRGLSDQYDDRIRQSIGSAIAYSTRWNTVGRSLRLSLNQQQQLATGQVSMTLPNLSFSQSARKPLARKGRLPSQRERWYETTQYTYNLTLDNQYSFTPLDDATLLSRGDSAALAIDWYDALFSPSQYRRATGRDLPFTFRATHRIPISAQMNITRLPGIGPLQFNLSPSLSYNEDWFLYTTRQSLDDATGSVASRSVPGFFALRTFQTSFSANTVFYGLFPMKVGPYAGLRHTVRPSLSFSFQPDYFSDFWGYTRTYVNSQQQPVRYPLVTGVPNGVQQVLSLRVGNVFETKRTTSPADANTTAASRTQNRNRSVQVLNLDFGTGYNFAQDSLRLAPISITGRSKLLGEVDWNFSAQLSPYDVDSRGVTVARSAFSLREFRLGRLTTFSTSFRTSLRSSSRGQGRPVTPPRAGFDTNPNLTGNPFLNPTLQSRTGTNADFDTPWTLSFDLTYNQNRFGLTTSRRAIFNTSFDFNLTPNWKVQSRTGYDFVEGAFATTNLALFRDFECWQMAFSWVPFGQYQSYSFDLHVKSGHLRDLLRIRQPKSDVRDRFGGL
jgi:lipopolysaccharide assembly outer membrane protein LptD (OstA)